MFASKVTVSLHGQHAVAFVAEPTRVYWTSTPNSMQQIANRRRRLWWAHLVYPRNPVMSAHPWEQLPLLRKLWWSSFRNRPCEGSRSCLGQGVIFSIVVAGFFTTRPWFSAISKVSWKVSTALYWFSEQSKGNRFAYSRQSDSVTAEIHIFLQLQPRLVNRAFMVSRQYPIVDSLIRASFKSSSS